MNQKILDAGTSDAIAFLKKWQSQGPWNLTAILETEGRPDIQNRTFGPKTEEEARAWLKARNGRKNLYFTVNDTKQGQSRKPKKEHMVRAQAFHVDVDPIKGSDVKDEQARIRKIIKGFPVKPTVVIFSGGGYQLFWKLKQRIELDDNTLEAVEQTNVKLERLLGGDKCWNIDRIMRLPGTLNIPNARKRKTGRKPVMARVALAKWEKTYSPSQFVDLPELPAGIAPWCGSVILTGERPDRDEPYPSRSEASYAVLCELKRKGMSEEDIRGVLLNTDFEISSHVMDQADPEKYFERQYKKAKVDVQVDGDDEDKTLDAPHEWKDLIFVRDQEEFFNRTNEAPTSVRLFNDEYVKYRIRGKESRTPNQRFLEEYEDQCVQSKTWDPALAYGRVEHKGLWVWNTWKAPTWFGKKGDGNIAPWLAVVKIVYAEFWETAVKRMAYDIQYPYLRPQWHLQAIGNNGIGKSDSIMPVTRWADRHGMLATIRPEMLKGQFNSWMSRKKIIVVNEPQGITDKVFNEMKDLMAGNETKISIEAKYANPVYEAIVASWYFGGNKLTGMSLTDVERRVFPVHSHAPAPTDENGRKAVAVRRHNWIRKNWPKVVWYLKHLEGIGENFASEFPGPNKYQREIFKNTGPLHMRLKPYIEEVLGERQVFTLPWVLDRLDIISDLPIEDSRRDLNNKTLSNAFGQMGITQWMEGKNVWVNGGPKRVWVRNNEMSKSDPDNIRFLWDMQGGEQTLDEEKSDKNV